MRAWTWNPTLHPLPSCALAVKRYRMRHSPQCLNVLRCNMRTVTFCFLCSIILSSLAQLPWIFTCLSPLPSLYEASAFLLPRALRAISHSLACYLLWFTVPSGNFFVLLSSSPSAGHAPCCLLGCYLARAGTKQAMPASPVLLVMYPIHVCHLWVHTFCSACTLYTLLHYQTSDNRGLCNLPVVFWPRSPPTSPAIGHAVVTAHRHTRRKEHIQRARRMTVGQAGSACLTIPPSICRAPPSRVPVADIRLVRHLTTKLLWHFCLPPVPLLSYYLPLWGGLHNTSMQPILLTCLQLYFLRFAM